MLLGCRIRELRNKKGLKQLFVASESGIDNKVLSAIETGRRKVSGDELVKIIKALGVSYEYFFCRGSPESREFVGKESKLGGELVERRLGN